MHDGLTIRTARSFPVAVVSLRGTLGPASTPRLSNALRKHIADQPALIVLDLSEAAAPGPAALGALGDALRSAATVPGIPVVLLVPDSALAERIHGSGLDRRAPLVADHAAALDVASREPLPRQHALRHLPPDPVILRAVRRVVAQACDAWGISRLTPLVELVATEVVTNAIEHAGTACDVTLALRGQYLQLAVRDGSPFPPRRAGSDGIAAPGGRGLVVVDGLTSGWGWTPLEDGKLVWALIALDTAPAAGNDSAERPPDVLP
jgi:anti-anti-sigma regulatory factor